MKFEDLILSFKRLGFIEKANEIRQTFFIHQESNSVIALPKHRSDGIVPNLLLQNIRRYLDLKNLLPSANFDEQFASIVQPKLADAKGGVKALSSEVWKPLQFPGWKQLRKRYALSSSGRIASYTDNVFQDGKLLSGSLTTGYKTLNLHRPNAKSPLYIHREIAKLFLEKASPNHKYVIHINHNKSDNAIKNLRWATLEDMIGHQQKSPARIAYKKVQANRTTGLKLTPKQVQAIKNTLKSKSRTQTIKQLAEKYGISETTMYRIKSSDE